MYTIEINEKNYPLKFGFDFMLKLNKRFVRYDDNLGKDENEGLEYSIAKIVDRDVETLVDVILAANATESDKINRKELIEWIENDDTDIDKVFEEVEGFFEKANCTKNGYRNVMKLVQGMANEMSEA